MINQSQSNDVRITFVTFVTVFKSEKKGWWSSFFVSVITLSERSCGRNRIGRFCWRIFIQRTLEATSFDLPETEPRRRGKLPV